MTAGTTAQTLLGSFATQLAGNKAGVWVCVCVIHFSQPFSHSRIWAESFVWGLAQLTPAALRKEEVFGDSFISNECQTYLLSRHSFERRKKQNISFPLSDIFSLAAVAVCSDPPALPSSRDTCWGVTPAFSLAFSPGRVGPWRDPPLQSQGLAAPETAASCAAGAPAELRVWPLVAGRRGCEIEPAGVPCPPPSSHPPPRYPG